MCVGFLYYLNNFLVVLWVFFSFFSQNTVLLLNMLLIPRCHLFLSLCCKNILKPLSILQGCCRSHLKEAKLSVIFRVNSGCYLKFILAHWVPELSLLQIQGKGDIGCHGEVHVGKCWFNVYFCSNLHTSNSEPSSPHQYLASVWSQ